MCCGTVIFREVMEIFLIMIMVMISVWIYRMMEDISRLVSTASF